MNSTAVAALALGALLLGYKLYGRKVAGWVGLDQNMKTPAVELQDGVDYIPAKHWTILFGHHFASIAGAAPIIGPVVACMIWGWVPALLWIVLGGIFFGAVHDYSALCTSVENKGLSVGTISEAMLGRAAKVVFNLFVLLALILVVAVFAAVAGQTLAEMPQVVAPTFGLIFVAIFVGLLIYKLNVPILVDTIIGLALLFGLIVLGYHFPIELPVAHPEKWWAAILLVYAMVAAVLPVSLLLQPRDHLAAGVLFFGMLFGVLGIAVTHPVMHAPAIIGFKTTSQGPMWPMLFVVIACGAISGFHSLVSSGTTSKQLPRARDAKAIGYGGMIMESALSVLAVVAVCAGLYWTKLPEGGTGFVYQDLMKEKGWISAFGEGYGVLTKPLFGSLGVLIGITMLKTFVMTTLDSATRITRYICCELFGESFGIKPLKNRFVATLLIGGCAGALALGNWKAIWPVFGSANQLIAGMALVIAAVYLVSRGRAWQFAAVPAALVFATAMAALVFAFFCFTGRFEVASLPQSNLLAAIAAALILLGLFVGYRSVLVMVRAVRGVPVEVIVAAEEQGEAEEAIARGPGC